MGKQQQIVIEQLTREIMLSRMDQFELAERSWTALGERAWTQGDFLSEKPQKWQLSNFVGSDSHVYGYAIVSAKNSAAYLHKMLVDIPYKGKGIGSALYARVREACAANRLDELHFKSRVDNAAANKIYDAAGCIRTGVQMGNDGIERICWCQEIEVRP